MRRGIAIRPPVTFRLDIAAQPTVAIPGWSTSIALTFGVVVTIFLGVFPQPILDLAGKAAHLTG